jgi:hypothetical protein
MIHTPLASRIALAAWMAVDVLLRNPDCNIAQRDVACVMQPGLFAVEDDDFQRVADVERHFDLRRR